MKIAIVHDWLVTYTGAEKVLEQILICYPQADVYSLIDFLPTEQKSFLQGKKIHTSFIQKLPFARKKYRNYLPWMPLAIEQFDLSSYDLIISSSHAVSKGVITGPDQLHVSYVHSPMRYAWDLQHQYLKEAGLDRGFKSFLIRKVLHKMRLWDVRTANGVDHFIANSSYISRRIRKTYRRESVVIHPPIQINSFNFTEQKEKYFLTASRLVPYKKIDIIVEAFSNMPDKKLVVIGDGPDFGKIKAKAKNNVELLGYQSDEILRGYLQKAKAFIFAAEEDFGILPVEAQACGTPVIAFGKGGILDTVVPFDGSNADLATGLFFLEQNQACVQDAVQKFLKIEHLLDSNNIRRNSEHFRADVFRNKFKRFVDEQWVSFRAQFG